jgi:hypothetical protein
MEPCVIRLNCLSLALLVLSLFPLGCVNHYAEEEERGRGNPNPEQEHYSDPKQSSSNIARPQQSASPSDPASTAGAAQGENPSAVGAMAIGDSSGGTNTQAVQPMNSPGQSGNPQQGQDAPPKAPQPK